MSSKNDATVQLVDLCDHVQVLSAIVHDKSDEGKVLDMEKLDSLMVPFYPCLEKFFADIKEEQDVVSIDATFNETTAHFTATRSDNSVRDFDYEKPEDEINGSIA